MQQMLLYTRKKKNPAETFEMLKVGSGEQPMGRT